MFGGLVGSREEEEGGGGVNLFVSFGEGGDALGDGGEGGHGGYGRWSWVGSWSGAVRWLYLCGLGMTLVGITRDGPLPPCKEHVP